MGRQKRVQESVTKSRTGGIRWEIWHNPEKRRYETLLWDAQSQGEVIGTTGYNAYSTSQSEAYQAEANRVAAAKREVDNRG